MSRVYLIRYRLHLYKVFLLYIIAIYNKYLYIYLQIYKNITGSRLWKAVNVKRNKNIIVAEKNVCDSIEIDGSPGSSAG